MVVRRVPLLVAILTAACSHVSEPPPTQTLRFDRWIASYRAYTDETICEAEPRWLFDELTSVNGVLAGFLKATAAPEGHDLRSLQLLEEAPAQLSGLALSHRRNIELARGCPFATQRGFPVLFERGVELAGSAQALLEAAPQIVERERALAALARWRANREQEEVSARLGCQALRARKAPSVYYAFEDEAGRTAWLFCDGARVLKEASGTPTFEPPTELTRAQLRTLKPESYLEAVRDHSPERVSRPPRVPVAPGSPDRPAGS